MSEYNPDVWVVVKIQAPGHEMYYRILAGWYGGYLGSDEWKLSSGIEKVIDKGNYFEVYNASGSVYNCHKETERMSSYTYSIFKRYEKQAKEKSWVYEIVEMKDTEYGKN